MTDANNFSNLVPGFGFLQDLVKNAGSALPHIGQWVAPTLNPEELEKRIEELRTVQFWLEQNARMLGATIQALEVQRMTLSTLKTMNVQMEDLRESLKIRVPDLPAASNEPEEPAPAAEPAPAPAAGKTRRAAGSASSPAPAVDPLQWWTGLTQQFAELASTAMQGNASEVSKVLASSAVKKSFEAAEHSLKQAAAAPAAFARAAGGATSKPGAKAKASSTTPAKAPAKAPARARKPASRG